MAYLPCSAAALVIFAVFSRKNASHETLHTRQSQTCTRAILNQYDTFYACMYYAGNEVDYYVALAYTICSFRRHKTYSRRTLPSYERII